MSDNPQPEKQAGSPDRDAENDGKAAQDPPDATAAPSVPPVAETEAAEPEATPSPTADATAAAEPEATPSPTADATAPALTQPSPTASEAPVREIQGSAGGLRVERPVHQQNEGPVKNFSITKDRQLLP